MGANGKSVALLSHLRKSSPSGVYAPPCNLRFRPLCPYEKSRVTENTYLLRNFGRTRDIRSWVLLNVTNLYLGHYGGMGFSGEKNLEKQVKGKLKESICLCSVHTWNCETCHLAWMHAGSGEMWHCLKAGGGREKNPCGI